MCVCVCVYVYIYTYIYIYKRRSKSQREILSNRSPKIDLCGAPKRSSFHELLDGKF